MPPEPRITSGAILSRPSGTKYKQPVVPLNPRITSGAIFIRPSGTNSRTSNTPRLSHSPTLPLPHTHSLRAGRSRNNLHAAILGTALGRGVGGNRVGIAMGKHPDAPGWEVDRRFLLQPTLDSKGAGFRERHAGGGTALIIGVAMDLNNGAAGYEQFSAKLV